jgi:hypothetical protein
MGHKAKILNTRIRHLKKEIFIRQRQFIKIYDDIFGRKPRKLVHQMDPTTARSMSFNHRRISRLLKCEQPKPSSTSQCRATKRFKKSHQYLKIRPPARKRKAISLRMGGMGTTMAITPSSDQGKQWHLPSHAHSESYSQDGSSTNERLLYDLGMPWTLYYLAPSRAWLCHTNETWRCCWCTGRPARSYSYPRDRTSDECGHPTGEINTGSDCLLDGRADGGQDHCFEPLWALIVVMEICMMSAMSIHAVSRSFPATSPYTAMPARQRRMPSPLRGLSSAFRLVTIKLQHSLCPLSPFLPTPALSKAWSSVKQVKTPKMTGVPVSN